MSDGCSGGISAIWKTLFRKPPPYEQACALHDAAYEKGGTEQDRLAADRALRDQVSSYDPLWARIMYRAVRIFGRSHFNYEPTTNVVDISSNG
jgi:hypothetical protein